ncbi:MAG: GIY-YIG nuclease family protein, partial [Anaerotardibacter sp.]
FMEKKGIVYILTNPCLDGWVKIGMTARNDIKKRLDELNRPANIPLMFRAYALYHVSEPAEVEKNIHALIDLVDDSLHAREIAATGKVREREFFKISPERAYEIFKHVARLRGDVDCLELVNASAEELAEEEIATTPRLKSFQFSMVDIPVGAKIAFIKDDSITATVEDDKNHILYEGQVTTMSNLAAQLLGNPGGSYQGPKFFTYEGEALSDRRARMEME